MRAHKKWIDLYQCQGGNYISMDRWLDTFRIVRHCDYTGRDIPRLYEREKYARAIKVRANTMLEGMRARPDLDHGLACSSYP